LNGSFFELNLVKSYLSLTVLNSVQTRWESKVMRLEKEWEALQHNTSRTPSPGDVLNDSLCKFNEGYNVRIFEVLYIMNGNILLHSRLLQGVHVLS
jgi:hypothetical protein